MMHYAAKTSNLLWESPQKWGHSAALAGGTGLMESPQAVGRTNTHNFLAKSIIHHSTLFRGKELRNAQYE